MMYPILCKVKYETLHLAFRERRIWVQILFSIFVNWIIAPFLMVSIALFICTIDQALTDNEGIARLVLGLPAR